MRAALLTIVVAAARSDDCPSSGFWKEIPCDHNSGPIGPADVSDDAVGTRPPLFRPQSTVGRLQSTQPHMHKWAEHKSKGQYDIPGPAEATKGFECDKSGLTPAQLAPFAYQFCQPQPDITNCSFAAIPGAAPEVTRGDVPCALSRVNPGDTIEIHWPHTSGSTSPLGPFDDVVSNALLVVQAQVRSPGSLARESADHVACGFCVRPNPFPGHSLLSPSPPPPLYSLALLLCSHLAQVFLVVNDPKYEMDVQLFLTHWNEALAAEDSVAYVGSPTGDHDNRNMCYSNQNTWLVDRKCHMLHVGSLDRWCGANPAGRVWSDQHFQQNLALPSQTSTEMYRIGPIDPSTGEPTLTQIRGPWRPSRMFAASWPDSIPDWGVALIVLASVNAALLIAVVCLTLSHRQSSKMTGHSAAAPAFKQTEYSLP